MYILIVSFGLDLIIIIIIDQISENEGDNLPEAVALTRRVAILTHPVYVNSSSSTQYFDT